MVTRPQWRGGAKEQSCRFSLEISLRLHDARLQAVLTLRQEPGHVALSVRPLNGLESLGDVEAAALATTQMAAIWRKLAVRPDDLAAPTDAPLRHCGLVTTRPGAVRCSKATCSRCMKH